MRAVAQRVREASVEVGGMVVGRIGKGLLLYLGISDKDKLADADYLVDKVLKMRVFEDSNGKMNLTLPEVGGALLVVSQFTLYGDCRKGRRPSFAEAAAPETARPLYQYFVHSCRDRLGPVETGVFGEMMRIRSTNDGPVTLLLDSAKGF